MHYQTPSSPHPLVAQIRPGVVLGFGSNIFEGNRSPMAQEKLEGSQPPWPFSRSCGINDEANPMSTQKFPPLAVTYLPWVLATVYAGFGSVFLIVSWRQDEWAPLLLGLFTFPVTIGLVQLTAAIQKSFTPEALEFLMNVFTPLGIFDPATFFVFVFGGACWYFAVGWILRSVIERVFFRTKQCPSSLRPD
jgi:hypothetical protein